MSLNYDDCLSGPDECRGTVEYRAPMSPSGKSFPRCTKHFEERLDVQEHIDNDYPENPPFWFDPTLAGEQWESD